MGSGQWAVISRQWSDFSFLIFLLFSDGNLQLLEGHCNFLFCYTHPRGAI